MGDDPYTDVDYKAEQVLIAHQRDGYRGCLCGWDERGRGHALHVWRELQRAVAPLIAARSRAETAEEIAQDLLSVAGREGGLWAAVIARDRRTTPTKEPS